MISDLVIIRVLTQHSGGFLKEDNKEKTILVRQK